MPPPPTSPSPSLLRRLGAAGPVAITLSFWPPLGGFLLLAFLTRLGPWLRDQHLAGLATYFVIAGALLAVSFVPTYACAILAGWAFGFFQGWLAAMAAITAGALGAYAIGRWIARDRVLDVIREKPSWNAVYRSMLASTSGQTTFVVTLLRIPPASPFAIANFVLAAGRVPLREYTIGTIVGIAPRTAMATYAAAQLEQLRFKNVGDTWMAVAGIAATIAACVVLGLLAQRALKQLAQPGPGARS